MLGVEYQSLIEASEEYRQINTPAKNIAEFELNIALSPFRSCSMLVSLLYLVS